MTRPRKLEISSFVPLSSGTSGLKLLIGHLESTIYMTRPRSEHSEISIVIVRQCPHILPRSTSCQQSMTFTRNPLSPRIGIKKANCTIQEVPYHTGTTGVVAPQAKICSEFPMRASLYEMCARLIGLSPGASPLLQFCARKSAPRTINYAAIYQSCIILHAILAVFL